METYKLIINDFLPEKDYLKLQGYLVQYSPEEGGGFYRNSTKGRVFLLHPSHLRGAKALLKKLNITPTIEIEGKSEAEVKVYTGDKAEMPIQIKMIETGIIVNDAKHEHFVSNENISIVWNIVKQNKMISPRKIWGILVQEHNMFPEFGKAMLSVNKDESLNPTEKAHIVSALSEYRASAFEGKRVKKKDEPNLTYYSLYWFPVLLLKRLQLIDQKGATEIYLTEKGVMASEWKTSVKEVLG